MANSLRKENLATAGDLYALRFKLVGGWKQTMSVIEKLPANMKESSILAQLKLGQDVVNRVKGHLKKQDLPWAPLKSETRSTKSSRGLDSRVLINRGTYLNNIKVWRMGSQKLVMIGVRRGIFTRNYSGRKGRLDVATVAAIHEFSTGSRVARRPLWNPSIKEMGGAPGFKKLFLQYFRANLKRKGVPIKDLKL